MTLLSPLCNVADETQRFGRSIRHRYRFGKLRLAQAGLIAVLAWVATRDPLSAVWFAAVAVSGLAEYAVNRRAHGAADLARWRRPVVLTQLLSALSFCAIAPLLLRAPDAIHLVEAALVLCASCLSNAMQASGSRLTALTTVAPPAAAFVLAPFWVWFAGTDLTLGATLLIAVGGLSFAVIILRLSSAQHVESEALRRARLAAEAGEQRWRMAFHNSPAPQTCFDASALHALLQAKARGRMPLGEVMLAEFETPQDFYGHVSTLEANQEALGLFGALGGRGRFTRSYLEGLADALNRIDVEGDLPPFDAELALDDGGVMILRAHLRLRNGGGGPWSLGMAAYDDVTDARLLARAQEEARAAAEGANRAKSDFLAMMSHEIRTPLNGVLGMAQAMERDGLNAAQSERVQVIQQSGAALMRLLDDVLDISRLDAGRLQLEAHEFDLVVGLQAAHAAFAEQAAEKSLAFTLSIDPALEGTWRGDSGRVRQILCNLVSNALKFTHAGAVSVRAAPSAAGVRIEVADTGIGIAPDRVARLFEKFVQADASATRAYGGTGLGLAICHELTRAMGGAITVASAPGQGSTFSVELPLRHVESARAEAGDAVVPPVADGDLRVLAAEDNAVNRMVLKALLAQFGVEPTLVENGAEAVRAWESAHWDLILMDVQMPVMDGPTAAMTIRAREALSGRARTPILAVTANTMAHQVASYRAAGLDDVVSKPIKAGELMQAIVIALASEPEEDALRAAG
jgi:signal transduction histidine kinase/AmiR/NasT family two-component response regulator